MENHVKKIESVLKLKDITIRNSKFERISSKDWEDFTLGFKLNINESDQDFEIIFVTRIKETDVFNLEVECGAFFELDTFTKENPVEIKNEKFYANALAIIFPYIRAYITQITAIPNMKPIILPVVNINALLEELKKEQSKEQS